MLGSLAGVDGPSPALVFLAAIFCVSSAPQLVDRTNLEPVARAANGGVQVRRAVPTRHFKRSRGPSLGHVQLLSSKNFAKSLFLNVCDMKTWVSPVKMYA